MSLFFFRVSWKTPCFGFFESPGARRALRRRAPGLLLSPGVKLEQFRLLSVRSAHFVLVQLRLSLFDFGLPGPTASLAIPGRPRPWSDTEDYVLLDSGPVQFRSKTDNFGRKLAPGARFSESPPPDVPIDGIKSQKRASLGDFGKTHPQ
jgi:hypothetical protein